MPLEPEDVIRKTFPPARFRGYNTDEVDAFLEEVVVEFRRLQSQIDEVLAELHQQSSSDAMDGRRLLAEETQLQQVRSERADLVREIKELQHVYDELKTKTSAARPAET